MHRLRLALAVVGITFCGGLATAAPASATLGDLTCTLNAQLYFSPALTAGSTSATTVSGNAVGCVSLTGQTMTSGAVAGSGTTTAASLPINPCALLFSVTLTATFTWNTGQQSTLTVTFSTNPLAGTVGAFGTVTSGPLAGDTLIALPVLATPNLNCLTAGLTTLAGPLAVITFA